MSAPHGTILVTGGAGFIGSNFVRRWLGAGAGRVVNLDKLTYAGDRRNLGSTLDDPRHVFVEGDICDGARVLDLLRRHAVEAVVHLAAETHVDRSILGPEAFVQTNVLGVQRLLEATRTYFDELSGDRRERFRLVHVSTDEVYGSLASAAAPCGEDAPYAPNSPYAASKAAGDHLVRAYQRTYGLPAIITNCTNNFGPCQHPEKLIPLVIRNALQGEPIPLYGDGSNVRDWLFVDDHCAALSRVLAAGRPGETYNISAAGELDNLTLVQRLCDLVDAHAGIGSDGPRRGLITRVTDRPGHDQRYALAAAKIRSELDWTPAHALDDALAATVDWYIDNPDWIEAVCNAGDYRGWLDANYAKRSRA